MRLNTVAAVSVVIEDPIAAEALAGGVTDTQLGTTFTVALVDIADDDGIGTGGHLALQGVAGGAFAVSGQANGLAAIGGGDVLDGKGRGSVERFRLEADGIGRHYRFVIFTDATAGRRGGTVDGEAVIGGADKGDRDGFATVIFVVVGDINR
ncbi:hypothetical protein EHLJMEHL_05006 [Vreelandella titanicae]